MNQKVKFSGHNRAPEVIKKSEEGQMWHVRMIKVVDREGSLRQKVVRLLSSFKAFDDSLHAVPVNFTRSRDFKFQSPRSMKRRNEKINFQGHYLHFNFSSFVQIVLAAVT